MFLFVKGENHMVGEPSQTPTYSLKPRVLRRGSTDRREDLKPSKYEGLKAADLSKLDPDCFTCHPRTVPKMRVMASPKRIRNDDKVAKTTPRSPSRIEGRPS